MCLYVSYQNNYIVQAEEYSHLTCYIKHMLLHILLFNVREECLSCKPSKRSIKNCFYVVCDIKFSDDMSIATFNTIFFLIFIVSRHLIRATFLDDTARDI